jgi:hypothetical protein
MFGGRMLAKKEARLSIAGLPVAICLVVLKSALPQANCKFKRLFQPRPYEHFKALVFWSEDAMRDK